jgi:hypothetical protein
MPGYTPRHWVPFSSPPTTRRATVEVFDPASTWETWESCAGMGSQKLQKITEKTVIHPVETVTEYISITEQECKSQRSAFGEINTFRRYKLRDSTSVKYFYVIWGCAFMKTYEKLRFNARFLCHISSQLFYSSVL